MQPNFSRLRWVAMEPQPSLRSYATHNTTSITFGWCPSSGLGTLSLASSCLAVPREAGASKIAFPRRRSRSHAQILKARHSGMDAGIQSQGCETAGWQLT